MATPHRKIVAPPLSFFFLKFFIYDNSEFLRLLFGRFFCFVGVLAAYGHRQASGGSLFVHGCTWVSIRQAAHFCFLYVFVVAVRINVAL